jgi:OmcA/MtrC family decaheme c-type cytochrome
MNQKYPSTMLVALFAVAMAAIAPDLSAQTTLAWDATQYFRYNIDRVDLDKSISPYTVKVIFSVSDPTRKRGSIKDGSENVFWDIKADVPFTTGTTSRLQVDVGWNTIEFFNTGAFRDGIRESLAPYYPQGAGGGGVGAAYPIQINALSASTACTAATCGGVDPAGRYFVTTVLPAQAFGTARAALEGHPAWPMTVNGTTVQAAVPVKNVFKDFAVSDTTVVPRRQIVDINKCKQCHTGTLHGDIVIPRLSLHGGNRTEEPGVCVMCHNPNQTDIPYRTAGNEESVDFKRMVHGIHAGGFRTTPLVIIGRNGSVNDFSSVRFPGELRDCLKCHIDINGKGTFELPVKSSLGSTINTRSVLTTPSLNGYVDLDPANDLKITPTAAACSACHDKAEVKSHMIGTGGASFSTLQSAINGERCVECHGPGRTKDVRRVHEVGGLDD